MPQSLAQIHLHLVFTTHLRRPWLKESVRPSLTQQFEGILAEEKCHLRNVGIVDDHVHLLYSHHRIATPSKVVEKVKARSSGWLKSQSTGTRDFAWQAGYAVFAVSLSGLPALNAYIDGQEEHHKVVSTQDELRRLLSEEGVEFDERYLWD